MLGAERGGFLGADLHRPVAAQGMRVDVDQRRGDGRVGALPGSSSQAAGFEEEGERLLRAEQVLGDITLGVGGEADDHLAVLFQPLYVVGVALELALNARERVRSLALLCSFAGGRQATPMTPRMIWVGLRTRLGPRRWRRRAFLELVVPPDVLAATDRDAFAERLATIFGHDLGDQPRVTSRGDAGL